MSNTIHTANQTAFELKAGSLTFTVFKLKSFDFELLKRQLDEVTGKAPNFFDGTAMIVDVTALDHTKLPMDVAGLISVLKEYRIIPICLRTYSSAYKTAANLCGLAAISQATPSKSEAASPAPQAAPSQSVPEPAPQAAEPVAFAGKTMVVDTAVRSGKQLYAKGCDLIITKSVSPGAEVIADGNIHIYGNLKGRALAGAQGDEEARIFCHELDAELVAIAGNYLVNEQIPAPNKNNKQLLEISLKEGSLHFNSV